jgi:HAE1 family hydrophobic/amphiphilic exporter-1
MGQAVIGGIITSSILTLVVVPVIYTWLDDFAVWARKRLGPSATHSSGGDSASTTGTVPRNNDPV